MFRGIQRSKSHQNWMKNKNLRYFVITKSAILAPYSSETEELWKIRQHHTGGLCQEKSKETNPIKIQ